MQCIRLRCRFDVCTAQCATTGASSLHARRCMRILARYFLKIQ